MTIFIDASALVAIITDEPESDSFVDTVAADGDPIWSAMSCWESVLAVRRRRGVDFKVARDEVEATAAALPIRLVEVAEPERAIALNAYESYGKGRHEAKLNMGDCFAYACAKTNGAKLLYKGRDFIHTDLA